MPLIRAFRTPVWDSAAAENKVVQLNFALKDKLSSASVVPRVVEIASEWAFYGDVPGCDSWDALAGDGEYVFGQQPV